MINYIKSIRPKRFLKPVFLSIVMGMLILSGCKKDEEFDISFKQDFLGFYSVEDDDDGDITNYSISIVESDKGGNVIEITNFADFMYVNIIANIDGNKMTIPSQSFPSSNGNYTLILTGEGTLNGNTIEYSYNYFVDEKFDDDWDFGGECVATKQ